VHQNIKFDYSKFSKFYSIIFWNGFSKILIFTNIFKISWFSIILACQNILLENPFGWKNMEEVLLRYNFILIFFCDSSRGGRQVKTLFRWNRKSTFFSFPFTWLKRSLGKLLMLLRWIEIEIGFENAPKKSAFKVSKRLPSSRQIFTRGMSYGKYYFFY